MSLRRSSFRDPSLEKEFSASREKIYLISFRSLVVSLVFQSSAIYISNPLNIEFSDPVKLIVFLLAMIMTVVFYLIVKRKFVKYCAYALSICVIFYIIGVSEFVNHLSREIYLNNWVYFLLGINIQTGCLFLLVSRIPWTQSMLIISIANIFSWIRIIDLSQNEGALKSAIISMITNAFLVFSITYSGENGDRSTFQKLKLQNMQLEAFEELVQKVIPNAIFIMKEEKVLFFNEGTKQMLGVQQKSQFLGILKDIKVLCGAEIFDINKSFKSSTNFSKEPPKTLYDLIKICENSIQNYKKEPLKNFSCIEASLFNFDTESQQTFSCQVEAILWEGNLSVVIILSDISDIKNHFKNLDLYKDHLLATVSHELRTPLNGMLGMLELMAEEINDLTQVDRLTVTMTSAKLLLSMVNDILDFSLISKGKLRLKYESTNVTRLVEETLKLLEYQAKSKGLDLEFYNELSDKNENHIIDGNRIKQVLLNLIGNAIKYTNFGKVFVRVKDEYVNDGEVISEKDVLRTRRKMSEPSELKGIINFFECNQIKKCIFFEVVDTGIGIKEPDMANLFQLFSRVNFEDEKDKGGIGLGLAISQSLVCSLNSNKENAKIKVESQFGKGSKFSFPLYVEKEPSLELKEINEINFKVPFSFEAKTLSYFNNKDFSPTSNTTNFHNELDSLIVEKKKINVLVVDDDQINILVAKSFLESHGDEYQVFTASNGVEALEKINHSALNKEFFNIILMDCNMPLMDGYEASAKIKSLIKEKVLPPVPIIAITANVGNSDKEKCFQHGMDYFMTKPYTKLQLEKQMREALRFGLNFWGLQSL